MGGLFWEEFLGRNYLVKINKELMFLSRYWGNFVSMHKEGRRKEEDILILRSEKFFKKFSGVQFEVHITSKGEKAT